ncbi:proline-rich protein DC2.15 [Zea mays]|uniref:Proline-rich protein DC2.15 n=1 Tax=Zea mays TaxID=4577 RepID=A0A3L6DGF9_MAIZE|nr:proline-rich protein DC2.15 [Zea mays]
MAARAALLLAIGLVLAGCSRCQRDLLPAAAGPKAADANARRPPPRVVPRDALKLGVCADVLGLVKAKVGSPPYEPCCSLLDRLVDLEVVACLCTAIKANILGINLNLPIDLSLILNNCGKNCPNDFHCT